MKAFLFVLAAFVAAAYAEAPYPPSGWRPAKAFLLPLQFRQRYEAYGPPTPAPSYGPPTPAPSYGPPPAATEAPEEPEETTTEAAEVPTEAPEEETEAPEEEETTEEPTTEAPAEGRASEDNEVAAQPTGLYYVLLPDGRLQRVLYTPGSPEVGYNAQLRIADVEPVPPAPVYAYAGPLTRILRSAQQ